MEGLTTAQEVAKSIKPKLIFCSIISAAYDIPRIYLNVNLFGSLCSYYHNLIVPTSLVTTLRHNDSTYYLGNPHVLTSTPPITNHFAMNVNKMPLPQLGRNRNLVFKKDILIDEASGDHSLRLFPLIINVRLLMVIH